MAESGQKCYEFLNPNAKTVVVFNREIQAIDVKECIKDCVLKKVWQKDSNVIILSGHHTSPDGKLGATFSAFDGLISKHLEDLKIELGSKMEDLKFCHVPIKTIPTSSDLYGNPKYCLAGLSTDNLKYQFHNVLKNKEQTILIFASCFSKKSDLNDFLSACGLYPALFLSAEMGLVTEGQRFKLDKTQRSVLETLSKVKTKLIKWWQQYIPYT